MITEREKQVLDLREKGYSYVEISKMLGMTKSLVAYFNKKHINENKVKNKSSKMQTESEYEKIVCEVVPTAKSMNDLCVLMNKRPTNNNYLYFQRIIDKYNLDISHFSSISKSKNNLHKLTIEERFSLRNDIVPNGSRLKEELLKLGIKEYKCECCGNSEWNGGKIPLQLHHINGNRYDNRVENLQLLCPNCHAQTDNYAGRNINNKTKKKYTCIYCGKEFYRGEGSSKNSRTYCSTECRDKMNGRRNQYVRSVFKEESILRPTKDELIQSFKELKNFKQVGKKYKVSDNTIRKWCKKYDLPIHIKEMNDLLKGMV